MVKTKHAIPAVAKTGISHYDMHDDKKSPVKYVAKVSTNQAGWLVVATTTSWSHSRQILLVISSTCDKLCHRRLMGARFRENQSLTLYGEIIQRRGKKLYQCSHIFKQQMELKYFSVSNQRHNSIVLRQLTCQWVMPSKHFYQLNYKDRVFLTFLLFQIVYLQYLTHMSTPAHAKFML